MQWLQIYFKHSYSVLVVDIFRWSFFRLLVLTAVKSILGVQAMSWLSMFFRWYFRSLVCIAFKSILSYSYHVLGIDTNFSFKVSQFSSHFTISRRRTLVITIFVASFVIMRKRFRYLPQSFDTYLKPGFQSRPSLLNKDNHTALVKSKLNLFYSIKRCPVFSCEPQYVQKWEFKDAQHNQKLVQSILVSEGILTVDRLLTFASPPTGYAGARELQTILRA